MPTPTRSDNLGTPQPTEASDDEKAAMQRALQQERPSDLFERLQRENAASRGGTADDRRTGRK